MENNKTLKYHENQQFNSKNLQQYDIEGQKYFLCYLLRKNYNFKLKNGEIVFEDITSEDKVKEIIEKYNSESIIEHLCSEKETLRKARIVGLKEASQTVEKKLRKLKIKEKELSER